MMLALHLEYLFLNRVERKIVFHVSLKEIGYYSCYFTGIYVFLWQWVLSGPDRPKIIPELRVRKHGKLAFLFVFLSLCSTISSISQNNQSPKCDSLCFLFFLWQDQNWKSKQHYLSESFFHDLNTQTWFHERFFPCTHLGMFLSGFPTCQMNPNKLQEEIKRQVAIMSSANT